MKPFEFPNNRKNPATAAILSFLFIGLGQAYKGEVAKAAIFLILYALSTLLTLFLIGFVTTPILWVWSIADAYRSSPGMTQTGPAKEPTANGSLTGPDMGPNVFVRDLEKV